MLPCVIGSWKELGGGLQLSTSGAAQFNTVALKRPDLMQTALGREARDYLLDGDWMPDYLADKYAQLTDVLLEEVESRARGWRAQGKRAPGAR